MLITWVNFSVTDFPQSSEAQGSFTKTAKRNAVCVGIAQIPTILVWLAGIDWTNAQNTIILLLDGSEVLQPVQVQRVSNLSSVRVSYIKISTRSLYL